MYPSETFSATHIALAPGLPLARPVMFCNGILIPKVDLKNSCIASADSAGLAVKTKTSLSPLASVKRLASVARGPLLPSFTWLNSE